MRRSRGVRIAVCAVTAAAWVCAAGVGTAAKERSWRIVAGPYTRRPPEGAAPPIGRSTVRGVVVTVEALEPRGRAALVQRIDPAIAGDPFAPSPGRQEAYHTFRLVIDNRSAEDVLFQPGNVVLTLDGRHPQFPIDATDLYRLAVRAEAPDPEAMMEQAKRLIYDSSTSVPGGTRAERLLVFGSLPEKWKEMRVHFSFLQIGTETHSLSFLFHRRPAEG